MIEKKWLNQLETLQDLVQSHDEEAYPTCGPFATSEDLALPEAYRAVLAVVNGLEWDGHILYGHVADRDFATEKEVYDLLFLNAVWQESHPDDFLYLGRVTSAGGATGLRQPEPVLSGVAPSIFLLEKWLARTT